MASPCEERLVNGVTLRRFGRGEVSGSDKRFFSTDHLGSVREVTDSAAALLARYAFDSWGQRTTTAGTDITNTRFTGHRWEAATGVALTLYRAYDPSLGRWISEDPAGFADGVNRYLYVGNAPLSNVDPDGSVSVNVSVGETQRHGDLDSLVGACNGGLVYGCTNKRVLPQCDCVQNGCDGSWRARASISLSITVNVLDSPQSRWSADEIIREEMKHVNHALGVLKARVAAGEALEAQRFGSKWRCMLGCKAWVVGTYWAFWNDWTHVTNPHPN